MLVKRSITDNDYRLAFKAVFIFLFFILLIESWTKVYSFVAGNIQKHWNSIIYNLLKWGFFSTLLIFLLQANNVTKNQRRIALLTNFLCAQESLRLLIILILKAIFRHSTMYRDRFLMLSTNICFAIFLSLFSFIIDNLIYQFFVKPFMGKIINSTTSFSKWLKVNRIHWLEN